MATLTDQHRQDTIRRSQEWSSATRVDLCVTSATPRPWSSLWNKRQARLFYCASARRAWNCFETLGSEACANVRKGITIGEDYAVGKINFTTLRSFAENTTFRLGQLYNNSLDMDCRLGQLYNNSLDMDYRSLCSFGSSIINVCCDRTPRGSGYSYCHSISLASRQYCLENNIEWHLWQMRTAEDQQRIHDFRLGEELITTHLFRDIVPNPHLRHISLPHGWSRWQGGLLRGMANEIWETRNPTSGELCHDHLNILADAVEDYGCIREEQRILKHLRYECTPTPHVWGCWALDLFLGNK